MMFEDKRKHIEELSKLLLNKDNVSSDNIDNLLRLLRPATLSSSTTISIHSGAVKQRILQSILKNNINANVDSSILITKFEKNCDLLRRINSALLYPFLALLEPLSFPKINNNFFSHQSLNTDTNIRMQDNIYNNKNNNNDNNNSHLFGTNTLNNNNNTFCSTPINIDIKTALKQQIHSNENEILDPNFIWVSQETELKLLRDLLFIFQGIGGKYIKFDTRSESYVIDPLLQLNNPAKDTILCLCELGWLYSKVSFYIQKAEGIESTKGLVVQAFGFALQEELHDYYRLLAILEQELIRKSNLNNNNHLDKDGTSGLTLLRLKAWMQEPMDRMFLMARLVEGVGPLLGGALASRLHGHAQHGDPSIKDIVQRIMDSVCSPIYSILTRWLLHGDLYDPYDEFFIATRMNISPNNLWLEAYYLRPQMLPTFFTHALAKKILVIGKSISFIKACFQKLPKKAFQNNSNDNNVNNTNKDGLKMGMNKSTVQGSLGYGQNNLTSYDEIDIKDDKIINNKNKFLLDSKETNINKVEIEINLAATNGIIITGASAEIEDSLNALRYGGEIRLQELVTKIASSTDEKLLHLMESKFFLQTHLLALKKFMLLGQGDFVTCLMDSVGPELKKRSNQLYRHNLTGILEGALRSSNAQFEPSYVLDRVGVRLLDAVPGDTGWEVFSLDYAVDTPLNAVVHQEASIRYRRAFVMLWRLKRVEWSLAASWKSFLTFTHTRGLNILPKLKPVLHRCSLIRGRMIHVVNNLCAFLMFEVMESAWKKLQDNINQAHCLDDVITAHDNYLAEILDRALLGIQHETLFLQIQQMFQSILKFCSLEESLLADAMAAMSRRRAQKTEMEEKTKRGDWGVSDRSFEDPPGSLDGVPGYLINRLDESMKDYSIQFDLMMDMLKEQGEKAGEILRYLTFRLDFNNYHSISQSH